MSYGIVIDCPDCGAVVKTEEKAQIIRENPYEPTEGEGYFLLECLSCHGILLGYTTYNMDFVLNETEWKTKAERLYPVSFVTDISAEIPASARRDIQDAQKCFLHGIYSATAVLCGRALEILIKEKVGKNHTISKGLVELKNKNIIDERLFGWAEALRKERNIGAHASDEDTTKENAQDIIDFTIAIFDYVYVLSEKYEKYIARKTAILSESNKP
jgi:hypothetical protein